MRVALFDYGTGNLHSLGKALERGGGEVLIEADPLRALDADALVLPGVGAFGAAAAQLAPHAAQLRAALNDGLPCLGVCLGMQLLLESSEEGLGPGLGVISGRVRRLHARRIPHVGWNTAEPNEDPLFGGLENLAVYYANSFAADPADLADVIAWTEYDGDRFPAALRRGRTWGVQFHPEKSGAAGLALIANFLRQAAG